MNVSFVNLKKSFAIASLLLLSNVANAQVMWNLKGGWMNHESFVIDSHSDDGMKKERSSDWLAGLEMEIPLCDRLNLETGLRWKSHKELVNKEYQFERSFQGQLYSINKTFDANGMVEIPLRLTYKQPLGNNFSLHVGVRPYVSYIMDGGWNYYENVREVITTRSEAEWRDAKTKDYIHVGLEPSVAINWACLSLGDTYNIPCFYKGYKDENKPVVMATLGIRFKSSVWRYVGATLLTIATVGGAAASAWSKAAEANQNYNSNYSGGASSNSRVSSSSNNENKYNISEQQNYNTDKHIWGDCDSKLSAHFSGNLPASRSEVLQWQQRMKDLRDKWKARGKSFPNSANENKSTSSCPNISHSH